MSFMDSIKLWLAKAAVDAALSVLLIGGVLVLAFIYAFFKQPKK